MSRPGDTNAMQDDDCHAPLRDLQTYLDGECGAALARVISAHLDDCKPCVQRANFERELRVVIAQSCHEQAPAHLVERVIVHLTQRG
jgi:mycothiol system anti-sigma-R factor